MRRNDSERFIDKAFRNILTIASGHSNNYQPHILTVVEQLYQFIPEGLSYDELTKFANSIYSWARIVEAMNYALLDQPDITYESTRDTQDKQFQNKLRLVVKIYGKTMGWSDDVITETVESLTPEQRQKVWISINEMTVYSLRKALSLAERLSNQALIIWEDLAPAVLSEVEMRKVGHQKLGKTEAVSEEVKVLIPRYVVQLDEAVERAKTDRPNYTNKQLSKIWLEVGIELLKDAETKDQLEALTQLSASYYFIRDNNLEVPVKDESFHDNFIPISPTFLPTKNDALKLHVLARDYKIKVPLQVPEELIA